MVFGHCLNEATTSSLPGGAPGASIMESILGPEAIKDLPTIDALIGTPFFADTGVAPVKGSFKVCMDVCMCDSLR